MTILGHAQNDTECDACDQPIGASRAVVNLHVVCAKCAASPQASTGTSFIDQIADAMEAHRFGGVAAASSSKVGGAASSPSATKPDPGFTAAIADAIEAQRADASAAAPAAAITFPLIRNS
jgi:hypothetical protein